MSAKATITVEEAAALLGLSRSSAYEAIRNGSFPSTVLRINGNYHIPRSPLEKLLGIADTAGTRAGEVAEAERRVRDLRRDLRALHAHLGVELDRLDALLGNEADDSGL